MKNIQNPMYENTPYEELTEKTNVNDSASLSLPLVDPPQTATKIQHIREIVYSRDKQKCLIGSVIVLFIICLTGFTVLGISISSVKSFRSLIKKDKGRNSGVASLKTVAFQGLNEKVDSLNESLWNIRAELSEELSKLNDSQWNLKEDLTKVLTTQNDELGILKTDGFGCPTRETYYYNNYSGTCIRFVKKRQNWLKAKQNCETAGEHLITFPPPSQLSESFSTKLFLPEEWRDYEIWLGGIRENGTQFHWDGIYNETVPLSGPGSDWGVGEPSDLDGGEDCIEYNALKIWNDVRCSANWLYSICERKV